MLINIKKWNLKLNKNLTLLGISTESGFILKYKGDEIEYLFPWRRKYYGGKLISVGFMLKPFETLEDLDKEWDEFFKAFYKK
jgi:hypothetical protein